MSAASGDFLGFTDIHTQYHQPRHAGGPGGAGIRGVRRISVMGDLYRAGSHRGQHDTASPQAAVCGFRPPRRGKLQRSLPSRQRLGPQCRRTWFAGQFGSRLHPRSVCLDPAPRLSPPDIHPNGERSGDHAGGGFRHALHHQQSGHSAGKRIYGALPDSGIGCPRGWRPHIPCRVRRSGGCGFCPSP